MSADDDLAPREQWPLEWRDGARCAFLMKFDGPRERGGYPVGFHRWPLDRQTLGSRASIGAFTTGFVNRSGLIGGSNS